MTTSDGASVHEDRCVLIMDDDEGVRSLLLWYSAELGFTPLAAASGAELEKVPSSSPIVVAFVDLFMPEVDGFEAIPRIRSRWPGSRIIAISGASPLLTAARHLGADDILCKPFAGDEIRTVLGPVTGQGAPA